MNRLFEPRLVWATLVSAGTLLVPGCEFTNCADTRSCGATGLSAPGGAGGRTLSQGGVGGAFGGAPQVTECAPHEVSCADRCIDPLANGEFCGAANDCRGPSRGETCQGTEACEVGSCVVQCSSGLINCEGGCIDPLTDENFCGAINACEGRPDSGWPCGDSECIAGVCRGFQNASQTLLSHNDEPSGVLLGIDAQGGVVAAWLRQGLYVDVARATYDASKDDWTDSTMFATSDDDAKDLQLAANGSGAVELVWRQDRPSSHTQVKGSMRDSTGVWSGVNRRSNQVAGVPATHPAVSLDETGNAYVAWREEGETDTTLWVSNRTPGAEKFGTSVKIPMGGDSRLQVKGPVLSPLSDGKALLAWRHLNGGKMAVWASAAESNGAWNDGELIFSDPSRDATHLAVAYDGDKTSVAVFTVGEGASLTLNSVRREAGDWTDPVIISAIGADTNYVNVVHDGLGGFGAVWKVTDGDGGGGFL